MKYCSECGRKLIKVIVSAEKPQMYTWGGSFSIYSKYDTKTGQRQYASYWKCPRVWLWHHDNFESEAKLI